MATRRRTTLAAVSSSSLNNRANGANSARSSLAPTKRTSLAPGPKTSRFSISTAGGGRRPGAGGGSRPSLASSVGDRKGSVGHRRSSAYGGGGGVVKSDPRPLHDKNYVGQCIRNLVEYLSEHRYDQPIKPKTLTSPSGRDFNNIMGFLFRQIDPNYMAPGRFEDDVIPMLRAFHYPFQLSRSSLAAVGAPQTWPKVLGAISWIVEWLNYDERVEEAEVEEREGRDEDMQDEHNQDMEDVVGGQSADDKAFVEYLNKAYAFFLAGEDDQFSALEENFIRRHDKGNTWLVQRQSENTVMKEEIRVAMEAETDRSSLLASLEQRKADLINDKVKFDANEEKMHKYRDIMETKLATATEERKKYKAEAAALQEELLVLRERVAGQELSAEDVLHMKSERKRIQDGRQTAEETNAQIMKRSWELDMELSQQMETLHTTVHEYNSQARALMLVPKGATNAEFANFELEVIPENVENKDALLSNDVRGTIRPAAAKLKEGILRRTHDALQELTSMLDLEYKSETDLSDANDQCNMLAAKVRRLEEAYSREKDVLDQQAGEKLRRVDEEELALSELRDSGGVESRTEAARMKSARLSAELESFKKESAEWQENEHAVIVDALTLGTDFQENTAVMLSNLKERCAQYLVALREGTTSFDEVVTSSDGGGGGEEGPLSRADEDAFASEFRPQWEHAPIDAGNTQGGVLERVEDTEV